MSCKILCTEFEFEQDISVAQLFVAAIKHNKLTENIHVIQTATNIRDCEN